MRTALHLLILRLHVLLLAGLTHVAAARDRRDDRGDVPGWVLVTLMSVTLVTAITAVARPELKGMLHDALASVK